MDQESTAEGPFEQNSHEQQNIHCDTPHKNEARGAKDDRGVSPSSNTKPTPFAPSQTPQQMSAEVEQCWQRHHIQSPDTKIFFEQEGLTPVQSNCARKERVLSLPHDCQENASHHIALAITNQDGSSKPIPYTSPTDLCCYSSENPIDTPVIKVSGDSNIRVGIKEKVTTRLLARRKQSNDKTHAQSYNDGIMRSSANLETEKTPYDGHFINDLNKCCDINTNNSNVDSRRAKNVVPGLHQLAAGTMSVEVTTHYIGSTESADNSVEMHSVSGVNDDGDSTSSATWSLEEDSNVHRNNAGNHGINIRHRPAPIIRSSSGDSTAGPITMSAGDIAICQQLDAEYERALEERDVTYTARYQSVRQSACLSIFFMALFVILGTLFFERQAPDWGIQESLLFTIYTITTVGYGHLETPDTPLFQLYTIFFIFIGIAVLTIMIAQVYQCIALEANRATTNTDSRSSMRALLAAHIDRAKFNQASQVIRQGGILSAGIAQGGDNTNSYSASSTALTSNNNTSLYEENAVSGPRQADGQFDHAFSIDDWSHWIEKGLIYLDTVMTFFHENEIGRTLAVFLPFVGLIAIGAMVIGPLEGWTFVQSVYFSVVSLTTVGFGDYYPTRPASIWFCILWLPFSIGFMSLYFTNVAAFYLRLSDKNIERIERNLRNEIERRKEFAEQERSRILERAMRGQQHRKSQNNQNQIVKFANLVKSESLPKSVILSRLDVQGNRGDSGIVDALMPNPIAPPEEKNMNEIVDSTESCAASEAKCTSEPLHKSTEKEEIVTIRQHGISQSCVIKSGTESTQRRGFRTIPTAECGSEEDDGQGSRMGYHPGSSSHAINRREQVIKNSLRLVQRQRADDDFPLPTAVNIDESGRATSMVTMKDILNAIHQSNHVANTIPRSSSSVEEEASATLFSYKTGPESEFLSIRSSSTMRDASHNGRYRSVLKPSFALRALVQERFAEIIATDVAGYQSYIEIKDHTMSVTINTLKQIADKWLVPRRARKAFRTVAFESLYFVGEHGLITRGADALFALSPVEFHQIFAPLLAAFGDKETMEEWLMHTDVLAEVDLRGTNIVDLPDPLRTASAAQGENNTSPTYQNQSDTNRGDIAFGDVPPFNETGDGDSLI
jgi:Ion channel